MVKSIICTWRQSNSDLPARSQLLLCPGFPFAHLNYKQSKLLFLCLNFLEYFNYVSPTNVFEFLPPFALPFIATPNDSMGLQESLQ